MKRNRILVWIVVAALCIAGAQAAVASGEGLAGLWQYQEIVTVEESRASKTGNEEQAQGVLLSDLEAMPLHLLSKVFGKISYTAEFTEDQRFTIEIAVLYLRFHAQGSYSVQDGQMTLVYDGITGFEKLWWLGGFDHLTHCDAEHTLWETVAYEVSDGKLTFFSNGADLVFTR